MVEFNNNILNIRFQIIDTFEDCINELEKFIADNKHLLYDIDLKVSGNINTYVSMWLGIKLFNICNSISIFNHIENKYILIYKKR